MKKSAFSLVLTLVVVMTTGNLVAVAETTNPLAGKIIALDAGHGNGETGAVNDRVLKSDGTPVTEAEVNWDVVQALETKLKNTYGAYVVIAYPFSTRRDRVNDAVAKCAAL